MEVQRTLGTSVGYYSQMQPSLELTEKRWAVSLVVQNTRFSMHTMLVIETLQGNTIRNFKAHLMGPSTLQNRKIACKDGGGACYCWGTVGQVDIKELPMEIDHTRFRSQYETWGVSREQAQKMIDQIRKEKDNPSELNRPFHIFGEKSVFSAGRADFEIKDAQLLEMREQNPKRFEKKYAVYEASRELERIEGPDGKYPVWTADVPMKYPFCKAREAVIKPIMEMGANGIKERSPVKIAKSVGLYLAALPVTGSLYLMSLAVDLPRMEWLSMKKEANGDLFRSFESHVHKTTVVSQNCFNWARNKLTTVDVVVPERSCECLTPIPILYLRDQFKIESEEEHKR